jgi:hypothetical protein
MKCLAPIALSLGILTQALHAEESSNPPPDPKAVAAVKEHNTQIVSGTVQAAGVFVVQDDGSIKHIQSGMICPANYPNVELYQMFVYKTDGSDVGCDYRRADDKGGAWAKLSLFATKAAPGMTLDRAFAGYSDEIMRTYPDAKPLGPALKEDGSTSPLPPIKSEEFVQPLNGTTYTSQLYVAFQSGWVIEIRATFVGQPNKIEVTKEGGAEAAELALGDRVMGPKALFDAIGTIGK